jgi:hypothetical protein
VCLQLAIYEALARTQTVSHVLEHCARALADTVRDDKLITYPFDEERDEEVDEEVEQRVAEVRRISEDAVRYLREPTPTAPPGLDPGLRGATQLQSFDDEQGRASSPAVGTACTWSTSLSSGCTRRCSGGRRAGCRRR